MNTEISDNSFSHQPEGEGESPQNAAADAIPTPAASLHMEQWPLGQRAHHYFGVPTAIGCDPITDAASGSFRLWAEFVTEAGGRRRYELPDDPALFRLLTGEMIRKLDGSATPQTAGRYRTGFFGPRRGIALAVPCKTEPAPDADQAAR